MVADAFRERYGSPVLLALFVLGDATVVLLSFALVYRWEVAEEADNAAEDVILTQASSSGPS